MKHGIFETRRLIDSAERYESMINTLWDLNVYMYKEIGYEHIGRAIDEIENALWLVKTQIYNNCMEEHDNDN